MDQGCVMLCHSFIHSGYFCSTSSSPLLLRGAPDYSIDTVWVNMLKRYWQLQVNDFSQGSYVTARVGFEPATLRTEGTEPTTEPPCLVIWSSTV